MISLATPALIEPLSPKQDSPTSARSRRMAILSPAPPAPSHSPPVPVRSPLRPTPRNVESKPALDPSLSKRKHALIELLSSERAYASDLALIRDIHMPLALGLPAPFPTPGSPESSSSPSVSSHGPPMTKEDTKIIFGNVEELAVFSEVFCDKLEEALHGVLHPDGNGEDHVGELFLSMIPHLKPPYMTYITRHPSALSHLNSLPQTPALTAYLAQTHTLAQSYTHAWDLPSLLIKPVQRLLKYPLLLSAIMEDTEPGEARDRLREARDKVEEVARGVNEGRRRLEVVKGVLDGKHPPPVRLKSIKNFKPRRASKDNHDQIEKLEKRLQECETFVQEFAKNVVDWSMSLRDTIAQLERWSTTFGRVVGLGQPHGSEALELFTEIVSLQITPVWISLDAAIQGTLLPKLARLLATTAQPVLLLSHMHALRPQHLLLLDLPLSKTRPPTALLDASQSYLDLDAQLRAELPRYIQLIERGFLACISQFADWQARFWREVRIQWLELWDALGVEGDMTAGAADTVKVWWERWEEVDAIAANLGIMKPEGDSLSRTSLQSQQTTSRPITIQPGPTAMLATAFVAGPTPAGSLQRLTSSNPPPQSRASSVLRRHSRQSIDLDIDIHALSGGLGLSMSSSPEGHSPLSTASSTRRRLSMSRKDSDRPISRRTSDRPPITTNQKDPSSTQVSTERPSTARQDSNNQRLPKKTSVDSAGSVLSSPLSLTQPSPSSRTSIHTSGSSLSPSASRSSLNNRLSVHSTDNAVDIPGASLAPRTSHTALRPYGTPPAVAVSDLVSASFVPVLPGAAGSLETSSLRSSKKKAASAVEENEARGRTVKKPGIRKRFTDVFRSPSKRPPSRNRASAPATSAPGPPQLPHSPLSPAPEPVPPPAPETAPETAAETEPALPDVPLYMATVAHPFSLSDQTTQTYRGMAFLALVVGDTLEILSDQGHPRAHDELPIRPEDEILEDSLLIARDESGAVGWALASFLIAW